MKQKRGYYRKRHNRFFLFFRWLLAPFLLRKFRYTYENLPRVDGPCIVLANHNTDFDPLLISLSSHRVMYFVTSEHVMRAGMASKALDYVFAPISRMKGSVASSTVMQILRRLRDGHTVCMFAEGNRSFDGNTGEILPATAKMVKSSNATLITFRFTGGYFTSPRWSTHLRRGKMTGAPVNVYSPDQIKQMTTDEVYTAICRDLDENAYDRQEQEQIIFRGKAPAESLETMLFVCPQCGQIGTLHSKDAHLSCACGLDVTFSEHGFLSWKGFETIPQWDRWQTAKLYALTDANASFLLQDDDILLSETNESHHVVSLYAGPIRMTREALTFGSFVFPVADVVSLALYGRNTIVFTVRERHYEVKCGPHCCARKYLLWYQKLKLQQA